MSMFFCTVSVACGSGKWLDVSSFVIVVHSIWLEAHLANRFHKMCVVCVHVNWVPSWWIQKWVVFAVFGFGVFNFMIVTSAMETGADFFSSLSRYWRKTIESLGMTHVGSFVMLNSSAVRTVSRRKCEWSRYCFILYLAEHIVSPQHFVPCLLPRVGHSWLWGGNDLAEAVLSLVKFNFNIILMSSTPNFICTSWPNADTSSNGWRCCRELLEGGRVYGESNP